MSDSTAVPQGAAAPRDPKKMSPYRRSRSHDYTMPADYLVTLDRNREHRLFFATVTGNHEFAEGPAAPQANPTPAGRCVTAAAEDLRRRFPQVEVSSMLAMPTQVMLVVRVRGYVTDGLPEWVRQLKATATKAVRAADPSFAAAAVSLFGPGFHDRILRSEAEVERAAGYLRALPRHNRWRKAQPALFTTRHTLVSGDEEFHAYGNIFLLNDIAPLAVRISSKHTEDERAANLELWTEAARSHGVLVSPFISEAERDVRYKLSYRGARLVHISHTGLADLSRLTDRDRDLCAKGRLLFLSPVRAQMGLTREWASRLNDLAAAIAAGTLAPFRLRRPRP